MRQNANMSVSGGVVVKTSIKGRRKEKEVEKILMERGYSTEIVRNIKYMRRDYFGCADIIAINNKHVLLVAVTDRKNRARSIKRLREFTNHPRLCFRKVCFWYDWDGWHEETVG